MKRLLAFLVLAVIAISVGGFYFNKTSSAVTASSWMAGNIISDAIFYDSNAMSVADIQNFLNAEVPVCDTWGTKMYGSITRAQWGINNGTPAPFICLKDYHENPTTHATNFNPTAAIPAGAISAAQIIYNASKQYNINPKVLLVTIKKEAPLNLVGDDWPMLSQYKSALGFACPDTAPCDSQYYGFYNQVTNAAKQLRLYADYPDSYRRKMGGTYDIAYHPSNTSCASPSVYIQSQATAGLYNYTPYQPNAAALANMYGTGDSCSSYGNRNFWRIWNDWFGNTIVPQSTLYIPNGTYKITNPSSSKNLDVAWGSTSNGSKIWLYDNNSSNAQKWKVTRDSDGYYTFQNIGSGKYLDVVNASTKMGASLQLWSGNGSCAQKWAAISRLEGFSLLNACSGYALDIEAGNTSNGSRIQLWENNQSNAQTWSLISLNTAPLANGFYKVNSTGSLPLDTQANTTTNGSSIQISAPSDATTQLWQVNRLADGYYKLRNPGSSKYIDVIEANTVAGTGIQLWSGNGSCAQKWVIVNNGDSTYEMLSACSGMALDVTGGNVSTANTKVQIWEPNKTNAQKWNFSLLDNKFVPDGDYTILTTTGNALDITGGRMVDGTKTQIWSPNGTPAQKWRITKLQDNFYSLRSPISSKYLDLAGASNANGTAIQIWSPNGTCAQKWDMVRNNDLTYEIKSACSGKAIDVANGWISIVGTKIHAWESNKTNAQKWIFGAP